MVRVGALNEPSRLRRIVVDDVTLTYVTDGELRLKTDVFFPAIPDEHWRANPHEVDTSGRVVISAGGLLVERKGATVLIDAGFGPFDGDLEVGSVRCGSMLDSLKILGVSVADVDVVALTHLHVDHVGWLFQESGARPEKVFPHARYVATTAEWAFAQHRGDGLGVPAHDAVIAPLSEVVHTVNPPSDIAPGIEAIAVPGHTPGHAAYVVRTATGRRVIAFGDVMHIPAQLAHPEWASAPDTDRTQVHASRSWLLTELSQPDTIGFGCHFGDQPFGTLDVDGDQRTWTPVATDVLD